MAQTDWQQNIRKIQLEVMAEIAEEQRKQAEEEAKRLAKLQKENAKHLKYVLDLLEIDCDGESDHVELPLGEGRSVIFMLDSRWHEDGMADFRLFEHDGVECVDFTLDMYGVQEDPDFRTRIFKLQPPRVNFPVDGDWSEVQLDIADTLDEIDTIIREEAGIREEIRQTSQLRALEDVLDGRDEKQSEGEPSLAERLEALIREIVQDELSQKDEQMHDDEEGWITGSSTH